MTVIAQAPSSGDLKSLAAITSFLSDTKLRGQYLKELIEAADKAEQATKALEIANGNAKTLAIAGETLIDAKERAQHIIDEAQDKAQRELNRVQGEVGDLVKQKKALDAAASKLADERVEFVRHKTRAEDELKTQAEQVGRLAKRNADDRAVLDKEQARLEGIAGQMNSIVKEDA